MYEDTPQEAVHDLFSEAVFGDHPLGRPVIGAAEVISSIPQAEVAGYHGAVYVRPNIVVAAAGNLDHERLVEQLARAERRHAPETTALPAARPLLVQPPPAGLRFQRKDTEQYHVCLGAPGVSRSDRRRFAASLLDAILGGSASSRLFQEIREKRGMAYSVYTYVSHYSDTGLVGVYLGTREENLRPCLEIVAEQVAEVAAGRIEEAELRRAQENLKGRLMLSMESTANRMTRLGKSLVTDTELLTFERLIAEIEAVDTGAVAELAALLLAPGALSASGIGPSEERFREAVAVANPALLEREAA
jgi:predicted Zn-dependent peptidase